MRRTAHKPGAGISGEMGTGKGGTNHDGIGDPANDDRPLGKGVSCCMAPFQAGRAMIGTMSPRLQCSRGVAQRQGSHRRDAPGGRSGTGSDYFGTRWKPKSWNARHRLILIGKQVGRQHGMPTQPDLFRPMEYGYGFKVIVTNKRTVPRDIVAFHEGRRAREGAGRFPRRARDAPPRGSAPAPDARPQRVLRRSASGRWEPFAAPSSGAPDALSARPANRSSP